MKTIACVFKSGVFNHPGYANKTAEYSADNVRWLRDQVATHYTHPHRFVCLSDEIITGVETIPLRHDWPGWWSKMEMFASLDQAFYIDLDTVIVRNIDRIINKQESRFMVLNNLSSPEKKRIGSAIMKWRGDYKYLYDTFSKDPEKYMAYYTTARRWGDQGFIQDHLKGWNYFQDRFPGAIVSQQHGMNENGDPKKDCRIVCFHGRQKPWNLKKSWIPLITSLS